MGTITYKDSRPCVLPWHITATRTNALVGPVTRRINIPLSGLAFVPHPDMIADGWNDRAALTVAYLLPEQDAERHCTSVQKYIDYYGLPVTLVWLHECSRYAMVRRVFVTAPCATYNLDAEIMMEELKGYADPNDVDYALNSERPFEFLRVDFSEIEDHAGIYFSEAARRVQDEMGGRFIEQLNGTWHLGMYVKMHDDRMFSLNVLGSLLRRASDSGTDIFDTVRTAGPDKDTCDSHVETDADTRKFLRAQKPLKIFQSLNLKRKAEPDRLTTRRVAEGKRKIDLSDTGDFWSMPADLLTAMSPNGKREEDGIVGKIAVLGLTEKRLTPIPFSPETDEKVTDFCDVRWSDAPEVNRMTHWSSSKSRVYIHAGEDGFRFLFALRVLYQKMSGSTRKRVAMLTFGHFAKYPTVAQNIRRNFRGAGPEINETLNAIPGLADALTIALAFARRKASEVDREFWGEYGEAAALPRGTILSFPGWGEEIIREEHLIKKPTAAHYHRLGGDNASAFIDGPYSLHIQNGRDRYYDRALPATRVIDVVRECLVLAGQSKIKAGSSETMDPLKVCTSVQRYISPDDLDSNTGDMPMIAAPVTRRVLSLDQGGLKPGSLTQWVARA